MSVEFRSEGSDLPIVCAQVESTGSPGDAPLRDGRREWRTRATPGETRGLALDLY